MILTIHTDKLIKQYKGRKVVDQVSVSVKQGEIVGLLGPNGAGKTTTFYMVVGLIAPDEGRVLLNEDPFAHVQTRTNGPWLPTSRSKCIQKIVGG